MTRYKTHSARIAPATPPSLADIQQAQSEREVDAIRARITQELAALGAAAPK